MPHREGRPEWSTLLSGDRTVITAPIPEELMTLVAAELSARAMSLIINRPRQPADYFILFQHHRCEAGPAEFMCGGQACRQ